jgi:hypothetical protein
LDRKRLGVLPLDRGPLQEPFDQADFYLADAVGAFLHLRPQIEARLRQN